MDPPDFAMDRYINSKFKTIGVEITRVLDPRLKQKEEAENKIVEIARNSFRSSFDDRLTVYVDFSRVPFSLNLNSLHQLAGVLKELVAGVVERNRGYHFRVETKKVSMPPQFAKVTITNEEGRFENWQTFGAWRVPHIDEELFINIVRRKEGIMKTYPEKFDEHWLILACNFGSESSHFEFTNLKKLSVSSSFDRIFVYKYRDDEVIKIKY